MFSPPASPARRCEFLRCRRSVGLWSEAGRVVLIRGSGKRSGPVRACVVIRIGVAIYLWLRRLFAQQLAKREVWQLAKREACSRAPPFCRPPFCRPPSWSLLFADWEDVAPGICGGRLADDADLSAVDSIFETAPVALIYRSGMRRPMRHDRRNSPPRPIAFCNARGRRGDDLRCNFSSPLRRLYRSPSA